MMAIVHCMQTSTTDTMDMTSMLSWGTMTSTMGGEYFFETSSTLITFVLLGRYLESLARGRTSRAITTLLNLQATTATRVSVDGAGRITSEQDCAASDIHVDDVVKVLRGQKIPADGEVVWGTATVDTSMLSGEYMPVVKRVDDSVSGAMLVSDGGPLYIRVTQVGADSQVAQIVRKVQQAQASRAPIQAFADRVFTHPNTISSNSDYPSYRFFAMVC
jgi:Cu+-exporting ATPase